MYCMKCGKEIAQESRFCGVCGTENPNYANGKPATISLEEMPKKSKKKIILIAASIVGMLLIAASIMGILLITFLIFGGKGTDLKYDWGTHRSEIEENECVLGTAEHLFQDGTEVCLTCDDPYREVDGLKKLTNSKETQYWLDYSERLYRIYYEINEDLSMTERLDILCECYGDDYYVETYDRDDARFYHYYWWIGDTVIEVYNDSIDYYDESYFLENERARSIHEGLYEYFDK